MKRFAISCLGVLVSYGAMAAGCDWATDTPPDDAKYKYFVARVYSDVGAADAQAKAEQEINSQICRLFGAETVTSSEFYSDTTSAQATSRTQERCVGVRLENFTKEKTGDDKKGREYIACVKYKYAISAYNKEKSRIASQKDAPIAFNDAAGDSGCAGAPIQITSTPSGAEVYIAGKYRGDTPLKIANVCRGTHKLEILHDNYVGATETLIIPNSTGKITKTLKRATREIKITADYPRATIKVNGVALGKSPVVHKAKMGDTLNIEASADGTNTAIRQVVVDKYSDGTIKLSLDKKPVKLDFSGWQRKNPGWTIHVDGQQIDTIGKITPEQSHSLKFTRDGFRTVRDSYSHAPTDSVVYFDKNYTFVPQKSLSRTSGTELNLLSGLGIAYFGTDVDDESKSSAGITADILALRMRTDMFYLRIAGGYDYAAISYDDIKLNDGLRFDANAGFNFGDRISAFGIAGYGLIDVKRPLLSDGNDYSGRSGYLFHGLGLEYNFKNWPASLRLTYTSASVDLWADHYVGRNNTKLQKIGLSFNLNWSALAQMAQ